MKGSLDLVLLACVLAAAWTRTPTGAVARSFIAAWQGTEGPDLFASFRTDLPTELQESIERLPSLPPPRLEMGPPPVLGRGVRAAIVAHLGEEALASIEAQGEPDAERALETWAIGAEHRDRAIERARSAGYRDPERFLVHRTFLADGDQRKGDKAVADVLALSTALDLVWPVDASAKVTSGFGMRHHPVLGRSKLHEGVDIAVPDGTPVRAAGAGKVARAREDGVNGKYVKIDHGHDVTSAYCHASDLVVEEKADVDRGQLILRSGHSGRATGPHLHFGIRIRGRPVDPIQFKDPTSS